MPYGFACVVVSTLAFLLIASILAAGCSPAGCEHSSKSLDQAQGGGQPLERAQVVRHSSLAEASPRIVPALPAALSGTVVRIRDGDSIVVLVGGAEMEVRLDSVDAPELAQSFGRRAKRFTSEQVFGRQVRLELHGKDKYERHLAEVFLPDGRSLNRELVSAGCAWWFRKYSDDRDLERRETQARAEHRGLWADPAPVPPWDFREAHPRDQGVRQ